jgi:hypothetical protein
MTMNSVVEAVKAEDPQLEDLQLEDQLLASLVVQNLLARVSRRTANANPTGEAQRLANIFGGQPAEELAGQLAVVLVALKLKTPYGVGRR